ncbi:MAG: iron-sulfur cluster assembly scaffold protein [Bacillota bacterium]|nr:iron-sulfur cluster assembly scaffold protein [Bacillota bacterium]
MYNDVVIDHFNQPRNSGKIHDCDAFSKVEGGNCGDVIFFYLSIEKGRIRKVKAKAFGCAAAIASASMLSTMLRGCNLEEARLISGEKIAERLGGLPEAKLPCAALAAEALEQALDDYEQRQS